MQRWEQVQVWIINSSFWSMTLQFKHIQHFLQQGIGTSHKQPTNTSKTDFPKDKTMKNSGNDHMIEN